MPVSHVVLGAGPVGRAVVTALAARGIETAVVTRSGTAVAGAVSRAADLADPAQAAAAVAGADVVFQCAPPAYHRWPEQFPALQAAAVTAAAAAGTLLVAAENLYGGSKQPGHNLIPGISYRRLLRYRCEGEPAFLVPAGFRPAWRRRVLH